MKNYNQIIYIGIVAVLTLCLLAGYVPSVAFLASLVTPPVALFLGLAFALLCGQAYPKFNKKVPAYVMPFHNLIFFFS